MAATKYKTRATLRTFARKFSSRQTFLKFLLYSDNELLASKMRRKIEVTDFVSEIQRVENYPDFEKLVHVIKRGRLWAFIIKNIEDDSTEANDLSHILQRWARCVNNSNVANVFTKPNPSRGISNRRTDKRRARNNGI